MDELTFETKEQGLEKLKDHVARCQTIREYIQTEEKKKNDLQRKT